MTNHNCSLFTFRDRLPREMLCTINKTLLTSHVPTSIDLAYISRNDHPTHCLPVSCFSHTKIEYLNFASMSNALHRWNIVYSCSNSTINYLPRNKTDIIRWIVIVIRYGNSADQSKAIDKIHLLHSNIDGNVPGRVTKMGMLCILKSIIIVMTSHTVYINE